MEILAEAGVGQCPVFNIRVVSGEWLRTPEDITKALCIYVESFSFFLLCTIADVSPTSSCLVNWLCCSSRCINQRVARIIIGRVHMLLSKRLICQTRACGGYGSLFHIATLYNATGWVVHIEHYI
jgi:hypothetical protein